MKRLKAFLPKMASGLALLVLLAGTAAALFFPPAFLRVQEVVVLTPLKRLSEPDLVRLSGVQKGRPLLPLSLSRIRKDLLRYPWIREVRLSKSIPGRILVWVEEQEPVALIETREEKGSFYLVNREGVVFKKSEAGDPGNLPLLTGLSESDVASQIQRLLALLNFFQETNDFKKVDVSELHLDEEGDLTLFVGDPTVRIELGRDLDETQGKKKIERLARMWSGMTQKISRMKWIDLSLEKRVVVKKG